MTSDFQQKHIKSVKWCTVRFYHLPSLMKANQLIKRRTAQHLFIHEKGEPHNHCSVTVLVQWFTENYYMLREKWNSVTLSRNLKAINLFITSRRIAITNTERNRQTDRQTKKQRQ